MEVVKGLLHSHPQRDNYWAHLELKSPKLSQTTSVFVCASHEYLSEQLKSTNFSIDAVNGWIDNVAKDLEKRGDLIFDEPVHLLVRTVTDDGRRNAIEFLNKEVISGFTQTFEDNENHFSLV